MNGILLVDKPCGLSSQTVVNKVKRILKLKKAGHAGTLDPLASGVLVVLLNEATKLSSFLLEKDKTYEAEITLGKSTDTLDSEGTVTFQKDVEEISDVDEVLKSFLGKQTQIPPMFSALKINGVKLYDLARNGYSVERQARDIEIYSIDRTSDVLYQENEAKFSFKAKVSKGTYIRTLCCDIGERLDYPAYMSNLRRISSGDFLIDNCFTLEEIENGNFQIIEMLDAINFMKIVEVEENIARKIKNGMEVLASFFNFDDEVIAFSYEHKLIAIYEKNNEKYKALRVWN